ncbi:hypothetical protein NA57DRAFT_50509 [Rhizodiscina lignyota]|uniref:Ubiquitin-like domain-containing protein n=1 Tax=Rhizodiscina lignyota TaxID=1504668 RepID=A0A9P4ISG1_9PEZI|nr:hypothetical protein NA57DRAFT_50509 [Rhizodiscina lignyota]
MAGVSGTRTMELKILCNVEEIGTQVFHNVPLDTTIGWLKAHLRERLPSHPPIEHQRLLYQGHFLEDGSATLASIFGENAPEQQTFHLVVRPPPLPRHLHAGPRTASAPPDPSRTQVPPPPQDPRDPRELPAYVPRTPHGVQVQRTFHPIPAQAQAQLPLFQNFNHIMQLTNTAIAGGVPHPPGPAAAAANGQQQQHQPQQIPVQQAAVNLPLGNNINGQPQPFLLAGNAQFIHGHPPVAVQPPVHLQQVHFQNLPPHIIRGPPQQGTAAPQYPSDTADPNLLAQANQIGQQLPTLAAEAHQRVQHIRHSGQHVVAQIRTMQRELDSLASNAAAASSPEFALVRAQVADLLLQAQALDRPLHAMTVQPHNDLITRHTLALRDPITTQRVILLRDRNSQAQALLIGPSGPYSASNIPRDLADALFSGGTTPPNRRNNRNDNFSTFLRRTLGLAPPQEQPAAQARNGVIQAIQQVMANRRAHQMNRDNQLRNQAQNGQAPNLNAAANFPNGNAPIEANANANANANEIRLVLQPLMSFLWLVVRVAGMIYFFGGVGGGGNGWLHWRPLVIAVLMMLPWVMNQGFGRRRWDAVRAHFEQLVGVQMHGGNRVQGQGQAQDQAQGQGQAQPTVEQVAENLMRQQQERERGWLREHVRGVERAVALFVASLWPGMGEGIVRAREAAEVRRVAQEQEAERARAEAARTQGEEAQDQDGAAQGEEATSTAAGPRSSSITSPTAATNGLVGDGASTSAQVHDDGGDQNGEARRVNKGKEKAVGEPSASTPREVSASQEVD